MSNYSIINIIWIHLNFLKAIFGTNFQVQCQNWFHVKQSPQIAAESSRWLHWIIMKSAAFIFGTSAKFSVDLIQSRFLISSQWEQTLGNLPLCNSLFHLKLAFDFRSTLIASLWVSYLDKYWMVVWRRLVGRQLHDWFTFNQRVGSQIRFLLVKVACHIKEMRKATS